ELKSNLLPALPRTVRQEPGTGGEIAQRGRVSGRCLGTLARGEVQFGHLLAFIVRGDDLRATIEMIDDLKDYLLALFSRSLLCQQPADSKMLRCALRLREQGIGGLLNAIMKEAIRTLQSEHEPALQRFLKIAMEVLLPVRSASFHQGRLRAVA